KGEFLTRNFDVVDVGGSYLDEYGGIGTALMQLPGGVQEAGTIAAGRGNFPFIPNHDTDFPQQSFEVVQLFDVRRESKIIAGLHAGDVRGDALLQRGTTAAQ